VTAGVVVLGAGASALAAAALLARRRVSVTLVEAPDPHRDCRSSSWLEVGNARTALHRRVRGEGPRESRGARGMPLSVCCARIFRAAVKGLSPRLEEVAPTTRLFRPGGQVGEVGHRPEHRAAQARQPRSTGYRRAVAHRMAQARGAARGRPGGAGGGHRPPPAPQGSGRVARRSAGCITCARPSPSRA
jgi:NAD(P)-binding Rossmann-like domain